MPPKLKQTKSAKMKDVVNQKILETDVETIIAKQNKQTKGAKNYQLDADEFEETFGLLDVEDEYDEVVDPPRTPKGRPPRTPKGRKKKNLYGGGRQTKGCNIWVKDMEVIYQKGNIFTYGKITKVTSGDKVTIQLFKKGELTEKKIEVECRYLSEDKTSKGRNTKAGLRLNKARTFKVKKANRVKDAVTFMRQAKGRENTDRYGRDVSQQAAMMIRGITPNSTNDPCKTSKRVKFNKSKKKEDCESKCEDENRRNDQKECCKTRCPQEGLNNMKSNPLYGRNQNVGKSNIGQPPIKINRKKKLQEDKYGYQDLKF